MESIDVRENKMADLFRCMETGKKYIPAIIACRSNRGKASAEKKTR